MYDFFKKNKHLYVIAWYVSDFKTKNDTKHKALFVVCDYVTKYICDYKTRPVRRKGRGGQGLDP
jgi:hypothetical protein